MLVSQMFQGVLYPWSVMTTADKLINIKEYAAGQLSQSAWTQLPDAPLTEAQKLIWQTYRENLQVVEFSNANPDLIVFPDPPVFTNSQPPAEVVEYRVSRADLRAQASVAIMRLEAIENAVAPTNAQIIAAVKDIAKFVRLIIKVLRRII